MENKEDKYYLEIKNNPDRTFGLKWGGYGFYHRLDNLYGGGYLGKDFEEVKSAIIDYVKSFHKETKITEPVKIRVDKTCSLFNKREDLVKLLQNEKIGVEFCLDHLTKNRY